MTKQFDSKNAAPNFTDCSGLIAEEQQALLERRQEALGRAATGNDKELEFPRVGLALSGGGVRSATFALGLMRGMAQSRGDENSRSKPDERTLVSVGLLGRLDYLSSVSGGGYTAGMYGRLVSSIGLQEAQNRLADRRSSVLEWLRRNGRYLTPMGSGDIAIAAVTFMRALLAIHLEFMFACMLLGLIVIAPHLWQHSLEPLTPQSWEPWLTPWWAIATALWLLIGPGLIAGYWAARDAPEQISSVRKGWRTIGLRDLFLTLVAAASSWWVLCLVYSDGSLNFKENGLRWPAAAAFAWVSLAIGQMLIQLKLSLSKEGHALAVARVRNQLTRALRVITFIALAIAGMGVLDRLSWWVLDEIQSGNKWLWGGVSAGGLAVIVLRSLMQPLQQLATETGIRARAWLPWLLNMGSIIGLLSLVLAWLSLLQWFLFMPQTFDALVEVPAWMRAALVAGIWLIWVLLTASNEQMANTSSLHSFYRARLTRAYLAVGNQNRGLFQQTPPQSNVTEVVGGDDISLSNYRPDARGGPIHLVNTCLNQTRDDQSGLYNADRKGIAVIASWRGLEVGVDKFIAATPNYDAGTLGRWIAVSGAAASPGAGSYTSRGLALLVYFLGVRLGLWVRAPHQTVELRWLSRLGWRFMPKPLMLTSEASATFFGVERPWWYLSDGGHFDNTGVYPLLKRELDFIILSDASSDARYDFGDIENMVRKARIDFGAEIDFYTREEAAHLFSLAGADLTVLSPEEMNNNHSRRGVLLARIRYRERAEPARSDGLEPTPIRPEGTLLVIKPNLHDELDADLLAYAKKHSDFPHESTGDQSFDEAQWESYHRLGEDFGSALHDSWLAQLPGWRHQASHPLRVAARLRNARDPDAAATAVSEPLWRRSARATAIGTTLGLGASGTLLLSLWQVQDQLQRRQSDERVEVRRMFTEVSKDLQSFDGACPKLPEHIVMQALRLLELRDSPTLQPLERGGVERISARLAEECEKPANNPEPNCDAARHRMIDFCQVVKKPPQDTTLDYWHSRSTPADQVNQARNTWHHLSEMWVGSKPTVVAVKATSVLTPSSPPNEPVAAPAKPATDGSMPPAGNPPEQSPKQPVPATTPIQASNEPRSDPSPSLETRIKQLPQACKRPSEDTTIYIQVYNEEMRRIAERWRQNLLAGQSKIGVQIGSVENVSRSAELRQQRRPVPWPKPTFVLHDGNSRSCAQVLGNFLQPMAGKDTTDGDKFWIRDLPGTNRKRQPGVIELWLPNDSLDESNELIARVLPQMGK